MKSFAVLCLLALALSPVWPKSVPETDESLGEREDEFDVTDLSADELKQFIDDARTGLKRAVEELDTVDLDELHTVDKRQKLLSNPGFKIPKFNFKPPPPPPKSPFKTNINLGKGFSLGLGGLTWRRKNMSVNLRPKFDFRNHGLKPTGGMLTFHLGFR